MTRYRFTGLIAGLALAATLAVAGCSDGPTATTGQPASPEVATSMTTPGPTTPATGRCPEGFDLIWIGFLPTHRQEEARLVEVHRLAKNPALDTPGVTDGYVCIKKPPPADFDKQPLVDNSIPLKE